MTQNIGRIQQLGVREVFQTEHRDFTPWLNQNLDILAGKLDLEIVDSRIEVDVGDFSCDITAKDSDSNKTIIIENQFGATDHDHLGKVITYASGQRAGIIIWIAEDFREEHKKALEWLNENADPESGISFFGVTIRVIKIGESDPAPDFDIIVKPNSWERNVRKITQSKSGLNGHYFDFFGKLVDNYSKSNPSWRKLKPQAQNWISFGAGKSGLAFIWAFKSNNKFSVELGIDTGNTDENKRVFDELLKQKENIENKFGGKMSWERLDGKSSCRIGYYKEIAGNIAALSDSEQAELLEWASQTMKRFMNVIGPFISSV